MDKHSQAKLTADGRHLEKARNHHISAAASAISKKFGTVKQLNVLDRSDH